MKPRQAVLGALLAATLAAAWWVGGEPELPPDADIVQAGRPAPGKTRAAAPQQPAGAAEPRFPVGGPDLFPAQSWRPPPPKPVATASLPPPPPMAPPLPFRFVGRWVDEQGETVFLAQGERVLHVRAGQTLDPWRLDRVEADRLAFTYLPLGQQQFLRLTP